MKHQSPTLTLRRWRINLGFGDAPRFVLAHSALHARLIVWRLARPA